jgi:nucleoside-diphosphate kinase
MIEHSLVLMKHDAVSRGVVGEILHRFERAGLKIVAMKMVHPDKRFVEKHYKTTDENLRAMGNKTLKNCEELDIDVMENLGMDDALEIGKFIWDCNVEFLSSGPLIAIVFEGLNAVGNIRAMVGHTIPSQAPAGTIRGDFSLDTAVGANKRKRSIYNLVHASGNLEEANDEIKLWFKPEDILSYKRVHEDLYSY